MHKFSMNLLYNLNDIFWQIWPQFFCFTLIEKIFVDGIARKMFWEVLPHFFFRTLHSFFENGFMSMMMFLVLKFCVFSDFVDDDVF